MTTRDVSRILLTCFYAALIMLNLWAATFAQIPWINYGACIFIWMLWACKMIALSETKP